MRIKLEKVDVDRCFGFSWVISKSTFDLFLFLYYFDVEIRYLPKDWMIYKGTTKLKDGREFKCYEKNERYNNSDFHTFIFPIFPSRKESK